MPLPENGIHYIPAEGVYAVFEVKPDLKGSVDGLSYIEYAGNKIESVRRLKRTSTSIVDRGTSYPPRPLTKIIGGILTSTNTYAKTKTIENHIGKLKGLKGIDMGCAVDYGAFFVEHNGEEDTKITDPMQRIISYYEDRSQEKIEFSKADVSLVSFFFQLMRYLQQSIGTVAAIDLNEYAQAINFDIDQQI
ncbi:MAG: hypothetical protein EOO43_19085 [Flavobacterium sp.]|nr:MAG: hypothetical protein EOO43_19085 [Flavobacterium sp.]